MTIDKAKLKALAEAMLRDEQGAELSDEEVRGFPEAVRSYEAMTAPSAVLALLAEIERLAADEQEATALCSRLSDLLRDVALAVRGPEEPLKRHGFADLPSRVKAVVAERDQLKAENEDYKSGQERYEQIIEDLKAEIEALRKDAELLALGRAKLACAMSRLRAKHNDWTAPEALPAAELVWCACGDGFPPNSYGAGFMDANNGICWSCDAAKAVSHD